MSVLDRLRMIGMLIPDGTNQFFSGLAQLFQRELAKRQWGVLVVDADGSRARETSNLKLLGKMSLEGLVFISVGDSKEAFLALREISIPLLVLDREIPLENADFVVADNAFGVRLAMEHLHALGHRRVACIQGSLSTEPGRERLRSYRECISELRMIGDDRLMLEGDFSHGSGVLAAQRLLRVPRAEWPTAIFACNDLMAIGVIQRLQEEGIAVPDQVSIIGYDDIPLSSWIFPQLTTVRQDSVEIAEKGARLLIERIERNEIPELPSREPRTATVEPKLVRRRSCRSVGE